MKPDILQSEPAVYQRGEQVVRGVLLHQIKPALPVDLPLDRLADGEGRIGQMLHRALCASDIQQLCAAEGSAVGRLPASLREKGGAVEFYYPVVLFLFAAGHRRGKAAQITVFFIEFFGHRSALPYRIR